MTLVSTSTRCLFFFAGFPPKKNSTTSRAQGWTLSQLGWPHRSHQKQKKWNTTCLLSIALIVFKTGSLCHGMVLWHNPHIYNWVSKILYYIPWTTVFFSLLTWQKGNQLNTKQVGEAMLMISKRTKDYAEKSTYSSWKVDVTGVYILVYFWTLYY